MLEILLPAYLMEDKRFAAEVGFVHGVKAFELGRAHM